MTSKIKISEVQEKPKATFFRKSVFQTTGDESFRFNFDLTSDQIENGNISTVTEENNKIGNTESVIADDNIQGNSKDHNTEEANKDSTKKFKFSFSSSQFKFNFDVNDS